MRQVRDLMKHYITSNRKGGYNYFVRSLRKSNALEIVTKSQRPDVHIKYLYAKKYLAYGFTPYRIERLYLESLRAFNNFIEDEPLKIGPKNFLNNFKNLINSVKSSGYSVFDEQDPVTLTGDGDVFGGAHRVSVCAALDLEVSHETSEEIEISDFNYEFFKYKGIEHAALDAACKVKASLDENLRILIVHSTVSEEKYNEIFQEIDELKLRVYAVIHKELSFSSLAVIKYMNYRANEDLANRKHWTHPNAGQFGGLMRHTISSLGEYKTRFFLISESSQGETALLKHSLRKKLDLSNHDIHSTEEHNETTNVVEFICDPFITKALRLSKPNQIFSTLEKLQETKNVLEEMKITKDCYVIGGSILMELFGGRKAADIDVYIESWDYKNINGMNPEAMSKIECHDIEDLLGSNKVRDFEGLDVELISLLGSQFVPIKFLYDFKRARNEFPKDIIDSEFMVDILELPGEQKRLKAINLQILLIYWKVLAKMIYCKKRIVQFLYSKKVLRQSYRYAKARLRNKSN